MHSPCQISVGTEVWRMISACKSSSLCTMSLYRLCSVPQQALSCPSDKILLRQVAANTLRLQCTRQRVLRQISSSSMTIWKVHGMLYLVNNCWKQCRCNHADSIAKGMTASSSSNIRANWPTFRGLQGWHSSTCTQLLV